MGIDDNKLESGTENQDVVVPLGNSDVASDEALNAANARKQRQAMKKAKERATEKRCAAIFLFLLTLGLLIFKWCYRLGLIMWLTCEATMNDYLLIWYCYN